MNEETWGDVNGVRTMTQGSSTSFGISILYNSNAVWEALISVRDAA
jgi:hypothetical protein